MILPIGKHNLTRFAWPQWTKLDANTMFGSMVLSPDFKEFLRSLNANRVRYLVAGAYAVAFHGYPRYTKDLDLWTNTDPENAAAVYHSLQNFGAPLEGLAQKDFAEDGFFYQMGVHVIL